MIDFKKELVLRLKQVIPDLKEEEISEIVEVPQDKTMGDLAFPCFKLAKIFRKSPQLIAKTIAEEISQDENFEKVEAVNAYVNVFISREKLVENTLTEVLKKKENFGKSDMGKGRKVIVEFSSPNIAKPFHIGHIRSTVIGNSLYKIYDSLGYNVIRINHLGDYGTQFGKMICAYRHWGVEEDVKRDPIKTLLSYYTKFHEEAEDHPELEDEARQAFVNLEKGKEEEVALWKWFRKESLKEFNRVYDLLGIEFDSYRGESFYSDMMPGIEQELEDKHLLEKSKGAEVIDLEKYGLEFALIKKSDGSSLYMTRDLAAAIFRKQEYDFYKNIYVVASQQNLHFEQLFKILDLMGYDWAYSCIHVPFGMVRLEEGTMSTRHGRVVFLEDVLNKSIEKTKEIIREKNPNAGDIDKIARDVGVGAVMFNELSSNRVKDYTFSWDQVLNFDGETGPYVQYTHARCASLLRKADEESIQKAEQAKNVNYKYLTGDNAYELVKLIYTYPMVVLQAGEKYEPSLVTRHLIHLAQSFNKFYHDEQILVQDQEERVAKLVLVIASKNVIKSALALLGVEAPERM